MPPETRKSYSRNKTPAPSTPPPAMESFMTQSIVPVEPEDDGDEESGVTYFVDEEGHYYFQPNPGDSNIVALDPESIGQPNQIQPIENLIMPDGEGNFTQTVTLVPSENTNGEVSYVLVVADENNSELGNINLTDTEQMDVDQNLESAVNPVASEEQEQDVLVNVEDFENLNDDSQDNVDLAFINDTGVPDDDAEEPEYPEVEEAVEQYNAEERQGETDVYTFEDDAAIESNEDDPPAEKKRKRKQSRALFTCNFCAYTSHRRYLLLRHMKSHSEDRPYKCTVCERGFKTQASLQNHVNMHNGVKPHTCKFCKSTFTTSGELVRHVRYKHTHEKPHKCNECDYASVELSKLRRHVRCHTGERPYQCPHCTYASPDTFKLKRHLRTHTGEKPYKCDMCTMCFTQSNSLKAHKLIHNVSEKPVYACELCPAKCGRKTDLRIHVQKLHTSEKPLKCKRCGKSFPDRYSCKVHNKTHEGEKCYKCDLCPYASTTLRHLKSHILKHTDEKPFACDHCDQTFRQKQLLRRHQNLYHNPDYVPKPPKEKTHTCQSCHRNFAHKGNLMRHMAVHDPESGHHERALALKLGRQKKVRYIDANSLKHPFLSEIKTEGDSTELVKVGVSSSLKRGELVTVSDRDGQQYVVLEVIQLDDGTEQQVAVVAPDFLQGTELEEEEEDETDDYGEEEALDDDDEDEEEKKLKQQLKQQQLAAERSIKLEKEVDTCFGFDVSEAEDEELEEEIGGSSSAMPTLNRLAPKEMDSMAHLLFEPDDDDDEEQNDDDDQEVVFELV